MKNKIKKLKKALVMQRDSTDCGAACLLSLIRYYDGDGSLEKLREQAGTNTDGTTLLGLFQTANKSGFDAEGCESTVDELIQHGSPVVLHVLIDNILQHYVVCYGYEDGKFIISDPAKGISMLSRQELEKIWLSRMCLVLKPNEHFVKSKEINKSKKKWIIQLIREDYSILGISVVLGVFIATLGIVMSVFSQKLIDDILPSKDHLKLILSAVLVALLLIGRVGLSSIRQLLLLQQSRGFNNRIIDAFYSRLLYLPKSFYDNRKIGDLVARLNDTGRIQRVITSVLGGIMIDALVLIVTLTFVFMYSWQAGLMVSVSLPLYFFIVHSFNDKIVAAQQGVMSNYAKSESNFINTIQGVEAIKNRGREIHFSEINQRIYGDLQNKVVQLGKIKVNLSILTGLFGVLFSVTILSHLSFQVFNDQMLIGKMMAIIGMTGALFPAVSSLAMVSVSINEAKVAFDRMFELVSEHSEDANDNGSGSFDFKSLSLKNISFRFPGRKPILDNVSLEVRKGELISIIGESGSGKSTLVQILQNFYHPESGQILINNKFSPGSIARNTWKGKIGVVPQEIHLFNGTVLENICLSNAKDDLEKALLFCDKNGFSKFINAFPQSFATLVGEEGVNLSGGQKQIVALARALLHQPQLLILDEPTAAMDRLTERFVMDLILKLKTNTAIILVSHRLHLLRQISERIYVLENGEINKSGNHEELLRNSNFYSAFWEEIVVND